MKKNEGKLNSIRREIQLSHFILIILITIFLSIGGLIININANDKAFDQNLLETAELISELYGFTKDMKQEELISYMDSVNLKLHDVDVISIVDARNIRIYHTNHDLIGKTFDGVHPDFSPETLSYKPKDEIGPSGPQRRTYSALYDENGNLSGFIMTIMLKKSMRMVTLRTAMLFLFVTIGAILIEFSISFRLSRRIKQQFMEFTEDFEGTKYLVDSMRANNHDFTNKLHVILGLIQIGQYDKAISYIENISIIQRDTLSRVMKTVDNPAFAALLIGKIARASECNVKFILKPENNFKSQDISIPSEALVTICGNLIDNALDAMNVISDLSVSKELKFGVYTKPGSLIITVEDNGIGISEENRNRVFEKGFSTKGENRGVGLFHTKQLVESLGGSIGFNSSVNCGTTFIVGFNQE